jgi:poly(A) polymerase
MKREQVLSTIYEIIRNWCKETGFHLFFKSKGMKQGLSEELAEEAGCKLVTFGSYRLGVHNPGSDIDTFEFFFYLNFSSLCIVPRHITRQQFFSELKEKFVNMDVVKDFSAVPDAYVPIMSFKKILIFF